MLRRAGVQVLVALVAGLVTMTALPAPAAAQEATGSVRGVVRRADDRRPIRGITVAVRSTGLKTVTDAEGRFAIFRVPAGSQVLVFRLFGFQPRELAVEVTGGQTVTADASLDLQPVTISEIVVVAASRTAERIVEAPAAVAVVEPAVARELSTTGQVPLALATVPGVDVVQSGINDFNVNARGFNSSLNRRILVLQDGRDLSIAFLGAQEWNAMAIPLDEIGRIEMVRGPGSALYGANAFAGVLNIITPAPREVVGTRVTLAAGELSTFRADVRHAGVAADGRLGYRVNLGRTQSDTWSRSRTASDSLDLRREYGDTTFKRSREVRPLNGQELGTANLATGERDPLRNQYGSARLDYYGAGGAVTTIEAGTARVENESFVTGIGRVQVTKADRPWARVNVATNRFSVMGWYSGRNTVDPQYSLVSGIPLEERSSIYHVEGQFNQSLFGDRGRLVAGASYRSSAVDTDSTLMLAADDDRTDNTSSAFGQIEVRLNSWVRAVVAARYDDGSIFEPQFSPKGALVFAPHADHSIRLTVNRAFQTPNYSEFFLRVPAGAPTASPRLLQTNLNAYLAAVAASLPPSVTAGLNLTPLPWNFDSLTLVQARGNRNLDVETVTGWEIGYKGNVGRRSFVTLDLYRNDMRNFVTDLLPGVNPEYPSYSLNEDRDVVALLDALDARLAGIGLPTTHPLRRPVPLLRGGFNQLNAAAGPLLATLPDGRRALIVSYTNAGRVIEQGLELGASVHVTDRIRFDGSYSLFDFEVREQRLGDQLVPNTPKWKVTLGLRYADDRADLGVTARFVEGMDWAAGIFSGYVPATQTITLAGSYRLTRQLRLHGVATNLSDQRRYHLFGGSVNGRRAIVGITADF
ncbi:MAG: TonB-dependent receptor [Gemmatimonadota bacterium]